LLLVRLTELINVKRLGTDLLLTTPAKGILDDSSRESALPRNRHLRDEEDRICKAPRFARGEGRRDYAGVLGSVPPLQWRVPLIVASAAWAECLRLIWEVHASR